MKILLIEPHKAPVTIGGEDVHLFESLALEYVAAGVSPRHDVRILDLRLDKNLQESLREFAPEVVGITAYTVHVNVVKRLFQEIKQWNPGVLTVVGGHHATVMPEDFLTPHIDLVVRGEGVFAFAEIVARRERGDAFDGIAGVAVPDGGRLRMNGPPPEIDLDALPFPARHLTANYRKHYYAEWMKPLASLRTSKGCPYRCSFCALWKLSHGRYFKRRPERIVEELSGIEEEYIFFSDDESLVDAERMKRLADLIRDAGIRKRYFLYGRSDTIANNRDLLEAWKDIGLERVFVGIEFFREDDLAYIRKGSHVEDNERAVRILQELGVDIYASMIVRPEFTREDFDAAIAYCRKLKLNFAAFSMLTPLPGTDFYEEVKDRMIVRDYDYFDFIHVLLPTALPLEAFYREYYRLYTSAVPVTSVFSFLMKYPLREFLPNLASLFRWSRRMRSIHLDYEKFPRR